MEIIRTISILKYVSISGRFQSDTFREHGSGISVFEKLCAIQSSGSICNHINNFYKNTVKQPPLYCIIDTDFLIKQSGFEQAKIEQTDGGNGDKCHYDITNSSKSGQEKFAKTNFKQPNIFKCLNGNASPVTNEELLSYYENAFNNKRWNINLN